MLTPRQEHLLANWCRNATSKRDEMDEKTAAMLRWYCHKIIPLMQPCATPMENAQVVLEYLNNHTFNGNHYKATSKRAILRTVLGFFVHAEILNHEAAEHLRLAVNRSSRGGGGVGSWSSKALTAEQLQRYFLAIEETATTPFFCRRNLAYFGVLLLTALRRDQVRLLRLDGLTIDAKYITVTAHRQKSWDQGMVRKIMRVDTKLPHGETIGSVLQAWLDVRPDTNFVFGVPSGEPMHQQTAYRISKEASERSGVKATPHAMRHTCATFVTNHMNLQTAAAICDHTDLNTTKRYIRTAAPTVDADSVHEAMAKEGL